MTATYGEIGLSYAAVNWSYDGTELNLGPYAPTVLFAGSGSYITDRAVSGSLASLASTGTLASFARTGAYPPDVQATGRLPVFAVSGSLVAYTVTGVIEHGD